MTPIETIDNALILRDATQTDGLWRDMTTEERHGILRAALRALAEMEPTEAEIRKIATDMGLECVYHYSRSHIDDDDIKVIRRSAILAAASEGEGQ